MAKLATVVVVHDAVKGFSYLENFVRALLLLNPDYRDFVDVWIVNQPSTAVEYAKIEQLRRDTGAEFSVHSCSHDIVDGKPMWDLMAELGELVPKLKTTYVTCLHSEEFFSEGYFRKLAATVTANRYPLFVFGNLRRAGTRDQCKKLLRAKYRRCSDNTVCDKLPEAEQTDRLFSDAVVNYVKQGQLEKLREELAGASTSVWHATFRKRPDCWREDVFFVNRPFLCEVGFFSYADRLYFHDIYNLAAEFFSRLHRERLVLRTATVSDDAKIYHLRHPHIFYQYSPHVIAWFAAHKEIFHGTNYTEAQLRSVAAVLARPASEARAKAAAKAMGDFCRGKDSGTDRFAKGLLRWMTAHRPLMEKWLKR